MGEGGQGNPESMSLKIGQQDPETWERKSWIASKQLSNNHPDSIRSVADPELGGWRGGGGEQQHKIYTVTFGGHLYYAILLQDRGRGVNGGLGVGWDMIPFYRYCSNFLFDGVVKHNATSRFFRINIFHTKWRK